MKHYIRKYGFGTGAAFLITGILSVITFALLFSLHLNYAAFSTLQFGSVLYIVGIFLISWNILLQPLSGLDKILWIISIVAIPFLGVLFYYKLVHTKINLSK